MTDHDLLTQGAKASAAIVMNKSAQDILLHAWEQLKHTYSYSEPLLLT